MEDRDYRDRRRDWEVNRVCSIPVALRVREGGEAGGGKKGPKETRLGGFGRDRSVTGLELGVGGTVRTFGSKLVWVWPSWRRWARVVARAAGEGEERVE